MGLFLSFNIALTSCTNKTESDGGGVGNGGDKLLSVFHDARINAGKILRKLNGCAIPGTVSKEVRYWLIGNNISDLLKDIEETPHEIQKDPKQETCASTENKHGSKIVFSLTNCALGNYTLEDATRLLIHESVHHLGLEDNRFTEDVTKAVLETAKVRKEMCVPNDAFDPLLCQGNQLTNSEVSLLKATDPKNHIFGRYDTYLRARDCNREEKCEEGWTEWKPSELILFSPDGKAIKTPMVGLITFFEIAPGQFAFRTAGKDTTCLVGEDNCTLTHGNKPGDLLFPFIEDLNQPLKLTQILTKNCLKQSAFFEIAEDGYKRQYQFVITSQF